MLVTLYDGKPVPKVIDFGVAKAIEQRLTERTLFTQYGAIVGTLEYMSPGAGRDERPGRRHPQRHLLAGRAAVRAADGHHAAGASAGCGRRRMREMLRRIKEEEPPRPSTRLSDSAEALASISAQRQTEPAQLAKLVRGELDWIVMKCLEKDRTRRYETASGLARDVQRYLDDEPVEACPPSAAYRLRKFAPEISDAVASGRGFCVAVGTGGGGQPLAGSAQRQRLSSKRGSSKSARLTPRPRRNRTATA